MLLPALGTAVGLALALNTVQAAEPRFELDLEAQGLEPTLKDLAAQANVKIRYADALLRDKTAPALRGRHSLRQALDRLLDGTELSYEVSPQGVITIKQRAGVAYPPSQNGDSFQLPALTVTANPMPGYTTAYDGQIGQHRNRFSAGFEYIETDLGSVRRFGATTSVDPFDPARGTFPSDTAMNFGTRQNFESKMDAAAVFLEDAFNLTPGWLLVGGLRYESIDLDRRVDDLISGATTRFGRDFESLSWRIGTVYDITPETALFAQYSKATVPITTLLLSNVSRAGFDLSTGYSIEAGAKSSFWGDRVIVTASADRRSGRRPVR